SGGDTTSVGSGRSGRRPPDRAGCGDGRHEGGRADARRRRGRERRQLRLPPRRRAGPRTLRLRRPGGAPHPVGAARPAARGAAGRRRKGRRAPDRARSAPRGTRAEPARGRRHRRLRPGGDPRPRRPDPASPARALDLERHCRRPDGGTDRARGPHPDRVGRRTGPAAIHAARRLDGGWDGDPRARALRLRRRGPEHAACGHGHADRHARKPDPPVRPAPVVVPARRTRRGRRGSSPPAHGLRAGGGRAPRLHVADAERRPGRERDLQRHRERHLRGRVTDRAGHPLPPDRDRRRAAAEGRRTRGREPLHPRHPRPEPADHAPVLRRGGGDLRRGAGPDRQDRLRLEVRRRRVAARPVRGRHDDPRAAERAPLLPPRPRGGALLVGPRLRRGGTDRGLRPVPPVAPLADRGHDRCRVPRPRRARVRHAADARPVARRRGQGGRGTPALTAAPRWGGFGVALLISTLLTVLWALPLVTHAGTRVLGGPSDATSTIRDYWYAEHVGSSPFSLRRDTLIAAPEGITRSPGIQVANAVQLLAILALKRAVGLVAAWNIFLLAGIALTAACTWLLLDCLGVGAVASFFGAYAFGLSGYLVNKAYAGHAGLVHAWVFPLLFLTLLRWRDHGRALAAAVAGAIAALAFYIHSYYGFFATFLIAAFFVYTAVADRRRLPPRRIARDGALTLATLVALLLPALVAMHLLRSVDTPPGTHSADSLQRFGAKIPAYVAPSSWSPLGHLVPHSLAARLKDSAEPSLFFGFSTLVLAALFVWLTLRGRAQQRSFLAGFCAVLVVAAFLASLPRLLTIGPVSLPMPSWFVAHVTTVWRVYARFGVLVGLGLVVLAALTVDQLSRRNRLAGLACVVVLVLELTPSLPAKTWVANDPPPADRWLAAHPGGIAAIYPLT